MAEKEYTERGLALEALCKKWETDDSFAEGLTVEQLDALSTAFRKIISVIETVRAADVVEVIRCRDCLWYNNRMCYHPKWEYVCEIPPTMFDFDFCRYGERKEDATD